MKRTIISYVNTTTNNTLEIKNSKFNLRGELVISDLLLSNNDSDTILILETLKTKYIPLISDNQYKSSLILEGLELYFKPESSDLESNNLQDDIFDNLFFDNLIITKSSLLIDNDTLEHSIGIDILKIDKIEKNVNGLTFSIAMFEGDIDKYSIDSFDANFELNNDNVLLKSFYLSHENQYLEGDLDFYLNEDLSFINFNESYLKFNLKADFLNSKSEKINLPGFISGDLNFSGSKNIFSINSASIYTDFASVDSKIDIENGFSPNPTVRINIKSLDFNKENINSKLKFDHIIDYPSLSGDLILVDNKITYNFNQKNDSNTLIDIYGIAELDDILSYNFRLNANLNNNQEVLDFLNINSLKIDSNISGNSNQLNSVESSVSLINDGINIFIDVDSYFNNNDLIAQIGLVSENITINSNVLGNNLDKIYKISSNIDIVNIADSEFQNFKTKANIDLDLSDLEYIKSFVSLQNIYIRNSLNEFNLESIFEINDLLDSNFIKNDIDYDFSFNYIKDRFYIESYLGEGLNFSGFYKNQDDLDLKIQISDMLISNFFEINKNPIKGQISSIIRLNRNSENKTLDFNSNISDISLNEYEIGEISLKVFGNTDFNSYTVNLDLFDKFNNLISGEGTVIAINDKPNIDIDLMINDFDISFIERIGLNTMSNISSKVSGEVNLWGTFDNIQHNGKLLLNNSNFTIPYLNIEYLLSDNSEITLYNQNFDLNDISIKTIDSDSITSLNGKIFHKNYKNWNLDLAFQSDRLYILNKEFSENESFYGKAFIGGDIFITGPTDKVNINIEGESREGTSIVLPNFQNYSIEDYSFIKFRDINSYSNDLSQSKNIEQETLKTLDLNMNLEINNSAEVEITVDQETGSYIKGKGNGDLFMEIDSDGKFNMYGDFTAKEGIYNFRNLALIDKKFQLKEGGSIIWDGEPLGAQMNIQATYNVPGGANPALLLDNPNFNKKIPTDVDIKLTGDLTKPDSPDFEIFFPNTSSTVTSEINYKLNDPEVRQLQAISLLTQGIFINEVSVSIEGVTNNIYEKVSEVFSDILGGSQGPLKVGLNYLQGDRSDILDIKTEDRFGVTLSTKISDKILFNGKIGVPIGGIEETLIIGDVQIDFILNEDGSLKAKVFNKENEFRYIGDELGYTQGVGLSYQVDFQTFRDLLSKIIANNN